MVYFLIAVVKITIYRKLLFTGSDNKRYYFCSNFCYLRISKCPRFPIQNVKITVENFLSAFIMRALPNLCPMPLNRLSRHTAE